MEHYFLLTMKTMDEMSYWSKLQYAVIIKTNLDYIKVCFMIDENGITHKKVVISL